jgi:hypothetical protein
LRKLHDDRVFEIEGSPNLFWSGLVNLGIKYVMRHESQREFVIILNADIEFDQDIVSALLAKARQTKNCQLGAVTIGKHQVISSGVKVSSWMLTINRHPLAGSAPTGLSADALIPVDFLPARCTLIPYEAIERAGLIAEAQLPHYAGDYEYTNRVRKLGYQPFIFTGVRVRLDTTNTGADVFHRDMSLRKRICSLLSIKSTANPVYRLRFVRIAYPWYAWPSAMLLYVVRSLLEVLLGGVVIKSLVRFRESGFSGS